MSNYLSSRVLDGCAQYNRLQDYLKSENTEPLILTDDEAFALMDHISTLLRTYVLVQKKDDLVEWKQRLNQLIQLYADEQIKAQKKHLDPRIMTDFDGVVKARAMLDAHLETIG